MTTKAKSLSTRGTEHPVGRITLIGRGNAVNDSEKNLVPLFADFVSKVPKGTHIKILITPAGFLKFTLPIESLAGVSVDAIAPLQLEKIQALASAKITEYISMVDKPTLKKFGEVVDYLTIGIDESGLDGKHKRTIELIAVYDVKVGKVIHYTGKFYPTPIQSKVLIRYPKTSSHFIDLNGTKIMILGCNDLNVFNPRGKKSITGWRADAYLEYIAYAKKYQPQIAIQHPHRTEHTLVWAHGWYGLTKALPSVTDYAGSVRARGESYLPCYTDDILGATKRGNIFEYTYKP
ncbi:MAG TPA: hypothetical protein PLE74_04735 [Candidatus Cloacimonadota bacterium]|nr:hypothetical protein [Candidatus Cloacimonadota bacterium]